MAPLQRRTYRQNLAHAYALHPSCASIVWRKKVSLERFLSESLECVRCLLEANKTVIDFEEFQDQNPTCFMMDADDIPMWGKV